MKKYFAELVGTFILVLFGCGTAVVAGDKVGILGIAFAFGLALIGAAYGIGPISGCHINPAVSLGVWAAGRMKTSDMIGYWIGQFAGAILAAGVLSLIVRGVGTADTTSPQAVSVRTAGAPATRANTTSPLPSSLNSWHADLRHRHSRLDAESRARRLCRPRHRHHPGRHSHLRHSHHRRQREPGAQPRSGDFRRRQGTRQVWLFLLVPSVAGLVAGLLFRLKVLEADEPMPEIKNRRGVENELAV